ncbi:MAG: hypothetical protein ACK5CR_10690, partial [Pseudanabaena sp.]
PPPRPPTTATQPLRPIYKTHTHSTGILYLDCSNLDLNAPDINTIYQKRWKNDGKLKSFTSF